MKTVQFAANYDGPLTVPALFPGAKRPTNTKVSLLKGQTTVANALGDALIAGGQFTLVEDLGPDPISAPPSVVVEPNSADDSLGGGDGGNTGSENGGSTVTTEGGGEPAATTGGEAGTTATTSEATSSRRKPRRTR